MRSKKQTSLIALLLLPAFFLVGCSSYQEPPQTAVPPHLIEMQQKESVARRFQESDPKSPSAVESAIELSERYAKLSDEAASLRQQNQSVVARNQQLNDQIVALETQLQQAKKELKEANDLLIEMRIELNNWKSNILGFREEIREAQTTQLEALLKILKLLGGQVTAESENDGNVGSAVASMNSPDRP